MYFPGICLERLGKTTKVSVRIFGAQAEIRKGDFVNAIKEPCLCTILLSGAGFTIARTV